LVTHTRGISGHSTRPPGQPQVRPLQTKSPVHALVQEPQRARLLLRLVQTLSQTALGATQVQAPPVQTCAPVQAIAQAPQLAALESSLTQLVPQRVSPPAQAITHAPLLQNWPAVQGFSHWPQFCASVLTSAQPLLHSDSPA